MEKLSRRLPPGIIAWVANGARWKATLLAATGLLLVGWLLNTPAGLLGKADAVGYAVCHRIDVRSFQLGERPISLCARCTGMYLGAVLALGLLFVRAPGRCGRPPLRVMAVLGALVTAFGVDGINSFVNFLPDVPSLYTPHNTLRLITGTGMGVVIAVAVWLAFNQTMWRRWDAYPVVAGFGELALLLGAGAVGAALILTRNPIILYPLTLVSAAGVLLLLTLVYAALWLIVLRKENRFDRFGQLAMPLVAGFAMAMLQVAGLDLIRYLFTGTWEGFHILLG